jgi:hypothetical protein
MSELLGLIYNLSPTCQKIESLNLTCDVACHEVKLTKLVESKIVITYQSLVDLMVIDTELGREDHGSTLQL